MTEAGLGPQRPQGTGGRRGQLAVAAAAVPDLAER